MKLCGRLDAASLGALGIGASLMNPLLWSIPAEAGLIAGAAGVAGLGIPRLNRAFEAFVRQRTKGVLFESDPPPPPCFMTGGYRIGVTRDHARPVDISDRHFVRHTALVGQSGVGKTTLILFLIAQQMARGGGFHFIDAKIDEQTLRCLSYLARLYGREDELYVLDVSNPERSHTYSPLVHGDADEKSSRLLNLQDDSPAADHYRQSAGQAFRVLFDALDLMEYEYTFEDFAALCINSNALASLESELQAHHPQSSETLALSTFLEQYRSRDRQGKNTINIDMLKKNIGGMVSRLGQFASGKFGRLFNTCTPDIDLFDIIINHKMLYVMAPTMGKDAAALNMVKMLVSDFRSVIARVQSLPESQRPFPYHQAYHDELGSYMMRSVRTLYEQGRSAGIAMIPGFQSFSQLDLAGDELSDILIQNTWNKVFFKFGSKEAPEEASDILGKVSRFTRSLATSEIESHSSKNLRTSPVSNEGGGYGVTSGWRETEGPLVEPDMLRSLDTGQAIVQSGADVFCVDTPMIVFPDELPEYEKVVYPQIRQTHLKRFDMRRRFFKQGAD